MYGGFFAIQDNSIALLFLGADEHKCSGEFQTAYSAFAKPRPTALAGIADP